MWTNNQTLADHPQYSTPMGTKWHKIPPYNDVLNFKFHRKFLIDTRKIITNNNQPKRKWQEEVQGVLGVKRVREVVSNIAKKFTFK